MTRIEIVVESANPALLDKVRAGLQDWNDRLALDTDGNGTHYDLEITADSDLPGEDSIVFGSVFDGTDNNQATVDALEKAYRKSFEHTTGPIEAHALRYAKALVLAKHPDATHLYLTDSDQGAGFWMAGVYRTDPDHGDGEYLGGDDLLCEDPDEISEDLWAPLSDLRLSYLEDHFEDPYKIPLGEIK